MLRARKVDEYLQNFEEYSMRYLDRLMQTSTTISGETSDGFFSNIWIPTRKYDPQTGQLAENYTYYNCGMSSTELADLYWTQYSGNYLFGRSASIDIDYAHLETRCSAIFKKNLGKYRHLMEIEGLVWNPLWNVDGIELHQILEQHADEITKDTGSGNSFKGQNLKDERNVAPYDSSGLKKEYEETHTGQDGSKTASASSEIGDVTASSTAGPISSVSESEASASSSVNVRSHSSFEYAVPIKDTAFGVALAGGDTLHTEKHVKQGNIGVTETTTLLNHARDYLRFSIIQEFFSDINKVILIGIYGSSEPVPWWYGQSSGGQTTPTHPDTGRTTSVHNSSYDMIQSVDLDEYGHVIGLTTCDGVTKVFTPMTQEQYEQTDPKDQALYTIYD